MADGAMEEIKNITIVVPGLEHKSPNSEKQKWKKR